MDAVSYSNSNANTGKSGSGRNDLTILDCFDRPIAFHRCFVTLTGSVTAALMLSQAVYWQRRTTHEDGWWWKTMEDWAEETGLSRKEQEGARRRLKTVGLLAEARRGVPAKLYYQVDLFTLARRLNGIPTHAARAPQPDPPECPKGAIQIAQKGQTGLPKRDKLDCPKGTNKFAPNGQTTPYNTETTTEITAETTTTTTAPSSARPPPGERRSPQPGGGGGSKDEQKTPDGSAVLLFDGPLASLSTAQQERARQIVSPLDPDTAQQVLDDWGQAIKTNSIKKSKWAWLDSVTRRAQAGAFTPTTDAAERRQAEKRRQEAQEASLRRIPTQPLPAPENRPKGRPEGLKRLLEAVSPRLARAAE